MAWWHKDCNHYLTTKYNRHIARVKYLHTPIEGQRKPSIVHRDVKSANILLDGDARARLCDVGLARDVDVGTSMTQGSALGTPGYICPEYQEMFEVVPAIDAFSFGVVLLELLTSLPAFHREQRPPMLHSRLRRRLLSDAAALADSRARFSPAAAEGLGELAQRCTAPTADERPPLAEVGGNLS